MNLKYLPVILICLAVGLVAVPRVEPLLVPHNTPINVPTELYGLDKVVPQTIKDKSTSEKMNGLCDGIADVVETDGKSQSPHIKYVANIFDLVSEASALCGKTDVEFGKAVNPIFQKEMPKGDVELDTTNRAKAVNLFRALGYSASLGGK